MIEVDDIGIEDALRPRKPWKDTPVGKSFFVEVFSGDMPERIRNTLSAGASYHWGKGNFSVMAEGQGYRVYRIKDRT